MGGHYREGEKSFTRQVKIERRFLLLHRSWLKRRHPPFSQRLVPVFGGKQLAPFLPFLSDWYRFYLPVHRNNTEVQHYPEPSMIQLWSLVACSLKLCGQQLNIGEHREKLKGREKSINRLFWQHNRLID